MTWDGVGLRRALAGEWIGSAESKEVRAGRCDHRAGHLPGVHHGFAFTVLPFLRRGYAIKDALRIALAADAASITIMVLVDNSLMLAIPAHARKQRGFISCAQHFRLVLKTLGV